MAEIGDADCYGGWQKILSDVAYNAITDSGKQNFDREGSYSRLAVVRKSGCKFCTISAAVSTMGDCMTIYWTLTIRRKMQMSHAIVTVIRRVKRTKGCGSVTIRWKTAVKTETMSGTCVSTFQGTKETTRTRRLRWRSTVRTYVTQQYHQR